MSKKYTGPRRCDLCQHEEHQPCTHDGKGCNIMTDYWLFKPKGKETKETGCASCKHWSACAFCKHWSAISIGKFCPDCGQALDKVNF